MAVSFVFVVDTRAAGAVLHAMIPNGGRVFESSHNFQYLGRRVQTTKFQDLFTQNNYQWR
jgi:hypothetical protein